MRKAKKLKRLVLLEKTKKKVCTKCKCKKEVTLFYFRDKRNSYESNCLECIEEYQKIYNKKNAEKIAERSKKYRKENAKKITKQRGEHYQENKEELKEKAKDRYQEDNEEILKKAKIYRDIPKNKEHQKEYVKKNIKQVRKNNNESVRVRKENDPLYKFTCSIRKITSRGFTRNGYIKDSHAYEILGCLYEEAKLHMELSWSDPKNLDINGNVWMSWANYGKYKKNTFYYGWDIDHRIPISANGESKEMILKLSKIRNLQPLCSYINRDIKRDIFIITEKTIN